MQLPWLRRQLVIFGSRHKLTANWHFYSYEASGFNELRGSPKRAS